ncbi:TrbM/KikA/MpfK family conjugal transfer protein [uncultured Turicimonas sp.]|uniref:TrbM/KikA/MpfK family conjugal transfer protein n=1 Tax=uncultured Turicimonas sp. TaxID=1918607 RepID=UPI002803DFCD|nr:TrbM/KikA/MpfK family conjugal transfer protein [uncultured Turicimonas sp.]
MKITQSRRLKTALCFIAGTGLLTCFAFKVMAQENYSKIPGMPSIDFMTGDDRWGCEVLLCLANPNGPRAVSECRPPIDKLFKCLSKRHPCSFPQCPMAGEGNYAKQLNDGFDPCSLYGLEDAPKGYLLQGKLDGLDLTSGRRGRTQYIKRGSSSYNWGGEHFFSGNNDEGSSSAGRWAGTKACVKGYQGTLYEPYTCYEDSGESSYATTCYRPVKVYEQVLWQDYQSRRAIDVYIDGKIFRRVHW